MSRRLVCPCGTEFFPRIFKESIQLLCDPCAASHHRNDETACPAWVPVSNVISLFSRFATGGPHRPVADGTVSGAPFGEVGGVTPVPLLSPIAPGARRG